MAKKVALVILDGFGINNQTPEENAIILAPHTPTVDWLFTQPHAKLLTHGRAVGLPQDQMGNSEVGHLTIGAGRVVKQTLVEIDDMLDDGSFEKLPGFQNLLAHCKENHSVLHIMTLFGPGGVHASDTHLIKLLPLLPKKQKVMLHLFGDGRDTLPQSMAEYFKQFYENYLVSYPNITVATISGRYYAMDRDTNRDRIAKAYTEMVQNVNKLEIDPYTYILAQYEKGKTDEFLEPASFPGAYPISDNDGIFFLNFRADRARQMTKIFYDRTIKGKENPPFPLKPLRNLFFLAMTQYYAEYDGPVCITKTDLVNTLGEVIAKAGLTQLRLAETEKFAHVTRFFNGERDITFPNQTNILIPSHKVATYDLDPEMAAEEIYQTFEKEACKYDFCLVNFANGDMVGHTGKMEAAQRAVQKLDSVLERMILFCSENNIDLLITADHGNCENMGTYENPTTSHTTNPVPFWYIVKRNVQPVVEEGTLADVAPSVLHVLGLPIPPEMTGKVLMK